MPRAKAKGRAKTATRRAAAGKDAIAVLKADHRLVEQWFSQFDKARDEARRQELATSICSALKVHATIEEEIFYPAFFEATEDRDVHHEAIIEHDGAKKLIAEIEASGPDDDYFDAKVTVLGELIRHHVKEEEREMFPEARKSGMDLAALGEQLMARKAELEGEMGTAEVSPAARKGRNGGARSGMGRH